MSFNGLRQPERPGPQGERGHPGRGAAAPQLFDRIGAGKDHIGFVAQDVQASGPLGATMCKTKNLDGREYGPRLSKARRGPVGRGEEAAEASRKA